MPTSNHSPTQLPFATRFPARPALSLRRRMGEGPGPTAAPFSGTASANPEAHRMLRQFEQAVAERERAVADAESRLAERTRDLDELEALLRAREALLAATRLRDSSSTTLSPREASALAQLKEELERQEATLREAQQALRVREQYVEESENRLFAKVQEQQEKETELEQREEDLGVRVESSAKRPYDEFKE